MRLVSTFLSLLLGLTAVAFGDLRCVDHLTDISHFFLLPPHEERYLIAVGVVMPDKKVFLSVGDYVGAHPSLADWVGFQRWDKGERPGIERPIEYFYGGEILIRNRTSETALGQIEKINVTSSYFFEQTTRKAPNFRNSPAEMLKLLSRKWGHLIGRNPEIIDTFDKKHPHLNAVDLGDTRHTFVDELSVFIRMAKEGGALGSTITRSGDKKISQTEEAIGRIEWMIPHLKRFSNLPEESCSQTVTILQKWKETSRIEKEEGVTLKDDLSQIWESYNGLRSQIILIEL